MNVGLESSLRNLTHLPTIGRLQGSDRTETAVAIARSIVAKNSGFTNTTVGIANGYTLDALSAGPAAGKGGYSLLLTESATSLGSGTTTFLHDNKATLTGARVFGSTASVSAAVAETARTVVGGSKTTTPAPVVSSPVADGTVGFGEVHASDTSFVVTFDGPVNGKDLSTDGFTVTLAGGTAPTVYKVRLSDEEKRGILTGSHTVRVWLDKGNPLQVGDVLTVKRGAVLNADTGTAMPRQDTSSVVLPDVQSTAVVVQGNVVLTPAVPQPDVPVVREFRDGVYVRDVLATPYWQLIHPTNFLVDGSAPWSLTFPLPTDVGTYTYTLQYVDQIAHTAYTAESPVDGDVVVVPATPVVGQASYTTAPGETVTVTLNSEFPEGQDPGVVFVSGEGDQEETTAADAVTLPEGRSQISFTAPTEPGTYRFRVTATADGLTSTGTATTELVVAVPVIPAESATNPGDGTNPDEQGTNPDDEWTDPDDDWTDPDDDWTDPDDDWTDPIDFCWDYDTQDWDC